MLSERLIGEIYKEVEESIIKKISERTGISEKKLMGIMKEEKGEKKEVNRESEKKEVNRECEKKGVESEKEVNILPWCGEVIERNCRALKINKGLYTQCIREKKEGEEYCINCIKLIEKNGGETPYGRVEDRLKVGIMEYVDPKGKKPVAFVNIMRKLNIKKEEVLKEAERLGWEIPECHFEEKKGKRGRPKKDTSAEDTESETSSVNEKKRGRPKKKKEEVCDVAGEELIASLLEQENELIKEVIEEDEEEEETKVINFEINGKKYLKSEENILYDIDSHDAIGIWNEETGEIEELGDEDDE